MQSTMTQVFRVSWKYSCLYFSLKGQELTIYWRHYCGLLKYSHIVVTTVGLILLLWVFCRNERIYVFQIHIDPTIFFENEFLFK